MGIGCDQRSQARVTKDKKDESKNKESQCPVSPVRVQDPRRHCSPNGTRETMDERICGRDGLSLETGE